MCRAWFALIALVGALGIASASRGDNATNNDLFDRLPADIIGAFSFDNAKGMRTNEIGQAITTWMGEHDALSHTRRAWGLFAQRLGVSESEAFDGLLGGSAVLAFGRKDAQSPADWLVLAAVESAMDVRMVRRTRAVPRKIVYNRAVLGLEEESFLLATLPPLDDGRSVLALAPSGAEWLLVRALAVSAGKAEALSGDLLRAAPTDAVVRGFWKPQGQAGRATGLSTDLERWLWSQHQPMHTLALWAVAREGTLEIGLSPLAGDNGLAPEPTRAAEGVLLDVVGPGEAIVASVLQRAGLTGLVPEGLEVTRGTGELVVRRGPAGVDLGTRLSVTPESAIVASKGATPGNTRVVNIRDLAETPGSRAIFGPRPEMAWTLLGHDPLRPEVVVAVTAGPDKEPGEGDAEPTIRKGDRQEPQPQAVAIVLEAADRQSPTAGGLRGTARPHELWMLLRSTVAEKSDGKASTETGFASLAALFDRARWVIETPLGEVRGRIVLELRKGERK